MRLLSVLVATVALAGCSTLTPPERDRIKAAKNICNVVNVDGSTVKLTLGVKYDGKQLPPQVVEAKAGAPGESVAFQTLWYQDLCMVRYVAQQNFDRDAWVTETGEAFAAWPVFNAATYDEQLAALYAKRDKHLQRLQEKPQGKLSEPMRFELFDAAIPRQDFLRIRQVSADIKLAGQAVFQGVDLGGSTGQVVVGADQFSHVIRPALNGVREAVARFAIFGATDMQMVQATVRSVYDAGALRLQQGKEAQAKK